MARSMTNIKSATNKCQTIGTYVILDLARTYHQHMTPAPNQHQKKQSECSATYKMEQVIDLWIKYTDTFTHTARTNLTNKATHHMEFHIRNCHNKKQMRITGICVSVPRIHRTSHRSMEQIHTYTDTFTHTAYTRSNLTNEATHTIWNFIFETVTTKSKCESQEYVYLCHVYIGQAIDLWNRYTLTQTHSHTQHIHAAILPMRQHTPYGISYSKLS
eukprot:373821_1